MRHCKELPSLETQAGWESHFKKVSFHDEWDNRRQIIKGTSWCILTKEVAEALGNWLKGFDLVIEPFAGTGHIAEQLRRASGLTRKQYRAYDSCISHFPKHDRKNYGFTKSGCFNINLKKADVVLMTWPNYNENLAYRIARKMVPGQWLVYNGEGRGGCTGDDQYHELLDTEFERFEEFEDALNEHHVRFYSIHDRWYIYRKR